MGLPIKISRVTGCVFYSQCFLCTLVGEERISGQSMNKPLSTCFSNWSFSSLQPDWIGGDGHNDALVLFVGLHKFSALLVQWNRSPIATRRTLNSGTSSHSNFTTVVASVCLQGQASTCPENVSKMTSTYSKLEYWGIWIRSTCKFTSGPHNLGYASMLICCCPILFCWKCFLTIWRFKNENDTNKLQSFTPVISDKRKASSWSLKL